MGRVKIQLKRIEDRQQRNIAFAKRKSGLLKKAYELYALCDVQIALIMFSPSGKLFVFDAKTRIEETIHKYVAQPFYRRPSLQDEAYIRRWVDEMRESSSRENIGNGVRCQIPSKGIDDAIEKCKVQLDKVEQELGYYLNKPNQWKSNKELERQEDLLQKTLDDVQYRMENLEVESEFDDSSSWSMDTSSDISSED